MLPAITPPTDNLYKFISLFGLTIFLFAVYNLGIVYDQSAKNKMQIEDLKVNVQQKIFQQSKLVDSNFKTRTEHQRFRPAMVTRLDNELQEIELYIRKSDLSAMELIQLDGEVNKLNVALDTLWLKQIFCLTFTVLGIGIMIFGFLRWKKKEQDIRDKILDIEHTIKQLESEKKRKKKKKTLAAGPELVVEKIHLNEQVDQN
jgi:hypothetical protein